MKQKIELEEIQAKIGQGLKLNPTGSWPKSHHKLDEKQVHAIIAAVGSERPILVKGEPGVGKSQMARAAAHVLKREFISFVVQPDTEYQELLWNIDYTRRLGDAQLMSTEAGMKTVQDKNREADDLLAIDHYIGPGPLWWAVNPRTAQAYCSGKNYQINSPADSGSSKNKAPNQTENMIQKGVVLLIDELDKADVSLSHSLLEVLGNGEFLVSPIGLTVQSETDMVKPLIILTSNNTRQLPAALERRCVQLNLELPEDLEPYLVDIGKQHFPKMNKDIRQRAASQIVEDRNDCDGFPKTGLAEYLDLLRALNHVSEDPETQSEWLSKLVTHFKKSNRPAF